ncbi:Ribosomal protein S18 acetylase RimI [Chitinophaga costaii]|uniref:Ribosomal protein S18 acetylase RimI n=1 Tax=Chitinophaga costaii TaxID=1335309 RepID=A0A1C4E0E1_9BACT|nr:GNAT family N-acetyltransferase [Chitinophaga costaii]PUZ24389.1 N-acetyltransferase [Chitinophaga costaii]SCC37103.1 Ribosomal protein S18 acetylase RimI [Chitinophaga costaii]
MEIRTLAHLPLSVLVDCFVQSFEGYSVKVSNSVEYYAARWKAAMVRLDCSYGMFDGELLVGFVLHAIDTRQGVRMAFNDGTGVLPAYRGRRIVQALYAQAIPALKAMGIALLSLEVIQQNEVALKAYTRVGFRIVKEYFCFKGVLLARPDAAMRLEATTFHRMEWNTLPAQAWQAWEHQPESLEGGNFQYYYVWRKEERVGYFVVQPEYNYVAQVDCMHHSPVHWNALLMGVSQIANPVKVNNVDSRQPEKIHYLRRHGLQAYIHQYEMQMPL